jgi:hypothetical protein
LYSRALQTRRARETVRASLELRFLATTDPKRAAALSNAEAALSAHLTHPG